MVKTSIEKVLHNLQFDRLFLDKIKAVEESRGGGEVTWEWSSISLCKCLQGSTLYAGRTNEYH